MGFSKSTLFFAGKRKFVVFPVLVGALMVLSFLVGTRSAEAPSVLREEKSKKTDVEGVKTIEPTNKISHQQPSLAWQQATLIKVIDGDTISVDINGKNEVVRIISIDTPEVVDKRKTVECFGKEASDFAKLTLESGKTVLLESDSTQGDRDKYNRLLRYVWMDGEVDFGKLMIEEGYASEYTYGLAYKYQDEYRVAERDAFEAKKGLWADNACVLGVQTSSSDTSSDMDCSDFSVQDEAQTYFESKGGSPTNNVDRLDSDHDGLACESLP